MSNRQHKNGVSPRNQTLHEQSGKTLCFVIGGIIACCFIKYLLWLFGGICLFIFLVYVAEDLWREM